MASESTAAALARKAAMLASGVAAARGGGGIRVSIVDDSAAGGLGFDRIFVGLGALPQVMPGALQALIPTIRQEHDRNFTTEGASGRGAWAGLSERTQQERVRLGYSAAGPILQRTGALRRHVLSAPAEVTSLPDGVTLRIAPSPDVGGTRKYRALALGHSTSNAFGRGISASIPGRPMVTVGPAGATRITTELSRLLRRLVLG